MLTPRFQLSQTDSEVTIVIYAPYANIKETEVFAEDNDFRFFSNPYYLRLNLPGAVVENDQSKGSYDCDKGEFTLKFSKVNKGEHFENLDMITTLLAPPKTEDKETVKTGPSIEVISSSSEAKNEDKSEESTEDGVQDEQWFVEQKVADSGVKICTSLTPKYGFASKTSNAFASFEASLLREIIDLPDPDATQQDKRRDLRREHERESFMRNEEHYMADLMEPSEEMRICLSFKPEWEKELPIIFNGKEQDILKELPNKEYLLSKEEERTATLGLLDILFASCYNHRVTLGENSATSGWTVNKLSSTLCWFQEFNDEKEAVVSAFRRMLSYPIYRSWELCMAVFEDVKQVLKLGKTSVIKRLCDIHSLFTDSSNDAPRYILNQLYIKDYLIWLQKVPSALIESLHESVNSIKVEKEDMELELVELETAVYSLCEEEELNHQAAEIFDLVEHVNKLAIEELNEQKKNNDSSTTTSSSSDSDSSTSDSDDTSTSSDSSTDSSDDEETMQETICENKFT